MANQLQTLLNEAHSLLREKENNKESLGRNHNEELTKVRLESEKLIEEWKSKLIDAEQHSNNKISELERKLNESEEKLVAQIEKFDQMSIENHQILNELKHNLGEKQSSLDTKIIEANQCKFIYIFYKYYLIV